MAKIQMSNVYLERIAEDLGVDLDRCTRVVIDLRVGDIPRMYVAGIAKMPDISLVEGVSVEGMD